MRGPVFTATGPTRYGTAGSGAKLRYACAPAAFKLVPSSECITMRINLGDEMQRDASVANWRKPCAASA